MSETSLSEFYAELETERGRYEELTLDWMAAAFKKVQVAVSKNMYVPTTSDWPKVSFSKNGLPSLSNSMFGEGPKNYAKLLSPNDHSSRQDDGESIEKMQEYIQLKKFLMNSDTLSKRLNLHVGKIWADSVIKLHLEYYIQEYCRIHGISEFDLRKAKATIKLYNNYIFTHHLTGNLIIPILLLDFECETFKISDRVEIVKLSKNDHLSRYAIRNYSSEQKNRIMSAASHAFKVKTVQVENTENLFQFSAALNKTAQQNANLVDILFATLRINKSRYYTGYAQILIKPDNWCELSGSLEQNICGITTNKYPTHLDDGVFWKMDREKVTQSELVEIQKSFLKLIEITKGNYKFAIDRFNFANDRDNSRDRVVDSVIGLEALYGDKAKTEITHKLSMRLGALIGKYGNWELSSHEIFTCMKKIYAYRSAIIHGDINPEKKREFQIEGDKNFQADWLAMELLGESIEILGREDQFLNPLKIDENLLLFDNN